MNISEVIQMAEKFVASRQDPLREPEDGSIVEDAHYRADAGQIVGVNVDDDWIVRVAYSYVTSDDVLIEKGVIDVYVPNNATPEDEWFEHDYIE